MSAPTATAPATSPGAERAGTETLGEVAVAEAFGIAAQKDGGEV